MLKAIPICVVLFFVESGHALADSVFGLQQYFALDSISEIHASPDGGYVAYTRTEYDLEKDTTKSSVWIQPTAGGEALRMTDEDSSASAPKWSPDGRYLAVMSDRKEDTSQIFLLDRRGGDAQQFTALKQGVQSYQWSPDGKQMLLIAEDPTPADLDKEELPNPRPYVIDRLQFKEDYVGYLDRYRAHIHVIDIASRTLRQVTSGDYEHSEPDWAPDNRHIVFVSNRSDEPDRNRNTDLWIVDASAENSEPVQLTTAATADASPSWSPDGEFVVYTSTAKVLSPVYALPRLTVINAKTRERTVIQALADTQVFTPRFSSDGAALLAITEDRGEQNLVSVDVATTAVRSLIEGQNIVTQFESGAPGELYALIATPDHPNEIFKVTEQGMDRLSSVSSAVLDSVKLARVEKHGYKGKDGFALETFVMFPPEYKMNKKNKKYPGILYIHGGPQSQFSYAFDYEAQLLAGQGYIVVMPNPRGSFGYGQDFALAIYQDWGGIDYEDVLAAMDFVIDKRWVDKKRTAVYGWSYGGIMTNNVITKTDRFDAAITGASATLYSANYGHDQYQRWWEEELGLPWLAENRDTWEKISPFYSLDNVKTPTLIVGGEDDWNVPIINSEQLYIALKRQGVPTSLVVYPGEGHILSVPSYEKDLYERYFAWLKQYVK